MVICLERGADLHMTQLMPLPLTVSCFSKIQIDFTFLVPAHPGSPGQRAVEWGVYFCKRKLVCEHCGQLASRCSAVNARSHFAARRCLTITGNTTTTLQRLIAAASPGVVLHCPRHCHRGNVHRPAGSVLNTGLSVCVILFKTYFLSAFTVF